MYVLLTQLSSDTIEHISANPGFIRKPVALPLQENTVCMTVPPTHKLFPNYKPCIALQHSWESLLGPEMWQPLEKHPICVYHHVMS